MPPKLEENPGFPPARTRRAMKRSPVWLLDTAGRADGGRGSPSSMPVWTAGAGLTRRGAGGTATCENRITLDNEGRYLLERAAPRRFQGLGQDHVVGPEGWPGRVDERKIPGSKRCGATGVWRKRPSGRRAPRS